MKRIKNAGVAAGLLALCLVLFGVGGSARSTVCAAGRTVAIGSCRISGDEVVCEIAADPIPSSDDGRFYVYADEVFEDGPEGRERSLRRWRQRLLRRRLFP